MNIKNTDKNSLIYGAMCFCHQKSFTFNSWDELINEMKVKHLSNYICQKGNKEFISLWLEHCENSIYKDCIHNFDNLGQEQFIFCDAGTKNGNLDIRVTDVLSNSLINDILCNNSFTYSNFTIDRNKFSVMFGELLGIFFSLLFCEKNKEVKFIFTDSAVCVFYWIFGINSKKIDLSTIILIEEVRSLLKKVNAKIVFIKRDLNKADITLGNIKDKYIQKHE